MRYAEITGWGKCVPPSVLSNSDLEVLTDTTDEWITTRTGIKERRISHVNVSDMAVVASHHALAAAGLEPTDIDLIVLATCTADVVIPSAASLVQAKLGATNAAVFDLNAACSGWIYALNVGTQMVKGGGHDKVLVIGAEKLSHLLDFTDRGTAVLFGDGAGAVVLEATDEAIGLQSVEIGTDGSVAGILCVPGVGTAGNRYQGDPSEYAIHMDGPEVFRRAVTAMGGASSRVVEQAGLSVADVDLLIPHQANVRIIDATARKLKLAAEQVFVNIASYGNTSAATIPMALTEAIEEGRVAPGANLVFAAFGAGLTWAAAVVRWGRRVEPLGVSDAHLPPCDKTAVELLESNVAFYGDGRRTG
ncbi:MAG: ketoacyl-ACP synthase III [Acidimicrobiia bacterium]|nr:ketoacyl-ACP synthase III [Acidimicrobiia bacterium]MDH3396850.1 ketoacyl-ACP synthase III [Acidimicrobiia bacterium]MDH5616941.1 ketoacyl-ACP synthase III [Acidimicrobiia bacterium]